MCIVLHDAFTGFKTLTNKNQLTNEAHLNNSRLRAAYRTHRQMANGGETQERKKTYIWAQEILNTLPPEIAVK